MTYKLRFKDINENKIDYDVEANAVSSANLPVIKNKTCDYVDKKAKIDFVELSTYTFGGETLYVTKHEDGRFEIRGSVTIPANKEYVQVNHPFNAHDVTGIASNQYSYSNRKIITCTCNGAYTRIDALMNDGTIPKSSTLVAIHVEGFWK